MFSLLNLISLPESQGGFGPDWPRQAISQLFALDPWHDRSVVADSDRACSHELALCCE